MLGREFEITNLGLMHFCLGIEVWQEPNQIFISQQKYAGEILKAFGMAECKLVGTPMQVDVKLSTEDSSPLVDEVKYKRLANSLIYLCNTRLDISFTTSVPREPLEGKDVGAEIHQRHARIWQYLEWIL